MKIHVKYQCCMPEKEPPILRPQQYYSYHLQIEDQPLASCGVYEIDEIGWHHAHPVNPQ